jgi:hypothetical protein
MSEKSRNLSARPRVEALEDRLLLSFQWGVGRGLEPVVGLTREQGLAAEVVVTKTTDQAAPLIRLRRIVDAAAAAQDRPMESISLNFAKIKLESLQPMGGGTTALSYESRDDKHQPDPLQPMGGGTTALSYDLKQQKQGLAIAAMPPADGTSVTSLGQTSLQAMDGGTAAVTVKPSKYLKIDGIEG